MDNSPHHLPLRLTVGTMSLLYSPWKKIIFLLIVVLLTSMGAGAQDGGEARRRAADLLRTNLRATGLSRAAIDSYVVTDAYPDKRSGNFLVYLQQTHLGIPVYNKISIYIFRNDTLIGKKPDIFRIDERTAPKPVYSVSPH